MMVRLLRHHRHSGVLLAPGTQLTLTDKIGQWLIEQGVAEPWLTVANSMPKQTAATTTAPRAVERKTRTRSCCGW